MIDFDVWYGGKVIGNLVAPSLKEAQKLAKKMYTKPVTVTVV